MAPRRLILTTFALTLFVTSACQQMAPAPTATIDSSAAPLPSEKPAASVSVAEAPAAEAVHPTKVYESDERIADAEGRRASARFADVPLVTHEGKPVQFVRDLVRDRIVVINLTYTRCKGSCPVTNARIMQLRRMLGPEFGQKIAFLSITVEPEYDTPEVLTEFSARFRKNDTPDLPPWIFLTGNVEDIEELRYSLGLFDPDPVVDADRTKHAGLLTYGNDRTNRWAATPSDVNAEEIAQTILRIAGETNNQRYASFYADRTSP